MSRNEENKISMELKAFGVTIYFQNFLGVKMDILIRLLIRRLMRSQSELWFLHFVQLKWKIISCN